MSILGRLESVPLREIWTNEAAGFTPWLSREENLTLLGEAIQAELTLESVERAVGPFRADLLCKDASDGRWVLIENQIERTDHTHLGQLITYAAGLSAVTIVWIAKSFTEQHRAALDWLNEVTGPEIAFYALEIELWRIGNSPAAPKFNVVSSPNGYVKARVAERSSAEAGPRQLSNIAYWDSFGEFLLENNTWFRPRESSGADWLSWGAGRAGVSYAAKMYRSNGNLVVRVSMTSSDAKLHFHGFGEYRAQIDAELPGLEWLERPDSVQSYIDLSLPGCDFDDLNDRDRQFSWMLVSLEKLLAVFGPYVRGLPSSGRA